MRRRALLHGMSGFAATSLLSRTFGTRASAADLPTVRVGLAEGDDATPTLYAIKAGLFRKYGLHIELTPVPSGAAGLAALAGGALDIVGTSLLPLFSAYSRGLPVQLVAPLAAYAPESLYAVMLVKNDAPYASGRDLKGKTIGSPALKDLNWLASMAWIDQNGGDSSTVTSIEIPPSVIPEALGHGRIDAATVTTPRYVQAVNAGGVRILGKSYEAISKHFAFAALAAHTEFANKNPDVIARFGRAIRDASEYANTHHADTLALYASFAKIDPKEIANAPRAISPPYLEPKEILPLISMAVRYKVLAHSIDPESIISPAALQAGK